MTAATKRLVDMARELEPNLVAFQDQKMVGRFRAAICAVEEERGEPDYKAMWDDLCERLEWLHNNSPSRSGQAGIEAVREYMEQLDAERGGQAKEGPAEKGERSNR